MGLFHIQDCKNHKESSRGVVLNNMFACSESAKNLKFVLSLS